MSLNSIKPRTQSFIQEPAQKTLLYPTVGNNPNPEYIKINVPNIQLKVLPKQTFSVNPEVSGSSGDFSKISYVIMYDGDSAGDPKESIIQEIIEESPEEQDASKLKIMPQESEDFIEYFITEDLEASQEGNL